MVEYEINESTQLIKPINNNKSIICEENTEDEINNSSNKIIKYNCSFYGSSYIGRCEGTKALTGIKTKFPIIIEESRNIIFFPNSSVR
jgi:competence protein ComK